MEVNEAVADPSTEPWAKIVETHSAAVIFLGDRVVKVKKPVDLGFLDFRSREQRAEVCHAEVQLNRRLAPSVYLGVLDILDGAGTPVEHAVLMRRLPESARFAVLVRGGAPIGKCIDRVAGVLADFHARCVLPPDAMAIAGPDAMRRLWLSTLQPLEEWAAHAPELPLVRQLHEEAMNFLSRHARLLQDRVLAGHVRDGHGDLLADDIFCLPDEIQILDCLEFERRFRIGDTVSDAAFLAMDLERLGNIDAAQEFSRKYAEYSHDDFPAALLHYYISYRAAVRAKVAFVRSAQGDASAADTGSQLIRIACRHAEKARVRVVAVGGLPGTGKSTLAGAIAGELDAVVISSDHIRKELAGIPLTASAAAGYREGIYAPEISAEMYRELITRARQAIQNGRGVVLDASWSDPRRRAAIDQLARSLHIDLVSVQCVAPPDVARRRLTTRAGAGGSDADISVHDRMAADWERWTDAVPVRTDVALASSVAAARAAIGIPGRDPFMTIQPGAAPVEMEYLAAGTLGSTAGADEG